MESFKTMTLNKMFLREELLFADDKALLLAFLKDFSLIIVTNIKMTLVIVQEEKGGYRHPTREFTGIGDFGQFRGADSEFRCYTEN